MNLESKEIRNLAKTSKYLLKKQANKRRYLYTKRVMDIILSILGLIISLPLFVIIAIIVKLDSKGPVIYTDNRIGKNGKKFKIYKFRTMHDEIELKLHQKEEWNEKFKLRNDPRITTIGKILRKTSLDELPQLINILKGDLSVVGPRPVIDKELEKYKENKEKFLSVKPGLTGYWQVNGRSNTTYQQRMQMELYYVENMCFTLDLKILFKTIITVIKMEGAI